MNNHAIVAIENPTEQDHGAIIHGMNHYAAGRGMQGTGGYFFAAYDENKNIIAAISGFDNFGPAETVFETTIFNKNIIQQEFDKKTKSMRPGDEIEYGKTTNKCFHPCMLHVEMTDKGERKDIWVRPILEPQR